jgi:hypothetical protein
VVRRQRDRRIRRLRRRYTRRSNQVQRSFEDRQLKQRGLELLLEA